MIDWFVVLTPLLLLVLLVPFSFLGCGLSAVGSFQPNAVLQYAGVVAPPRDPLTVESRQIYRIIVYWGFHGFVNDEPYDNDLPPQTKGSLSGPIPVPFGYDDINTPVPDTSNVNLQYVTCICDVVVGPQPQTFTTRPAYLPFVAGETPLFRLVRGVQTSPNSSLKPPAFSLLAQSVKN